MTLTENPISINTAPARRGAGWLIDGFTLFSKNWITWIGIFFLLIILLLFSNIIPIIGGLIIQIFFPVFIGGLMLGCQAADQRNDFTFAHLFSGFENCLPQLLVVGVVHLLGTVFILILCIIVLMFLMGGMDNIIEIFQSLQRATEDNNVDEIAGIVSEAAHVILLVELIGLALYLPLLMLVWFAPALITLNKLSAMTALKLSFIGCLRNFIPYLVYGLIGLVFSVIATIPLGLGWLVLTPIIITSVYLAYKDIYIQDQLLS